MESGIEGVVLCGADYRNLGAMINHSEKPNAEARCIFEAGVEQSIIIALRDIKKGEQVLIDYSENYGEDEDFNPEGWTTFGGDEFPNRIPI